MSWQAPNAGNREALARREANRMRDFVYRQQRGNLPPSMGGMGGGSVVGQNSMGNTVYAPHLVIISNKDENDNTQSNYEYLHVVGTCMNIIAPSLFNGATWTTATNSDIKWIVHTAFDGQIIILTPRENKTITLKTAGNINISSDMTIADNEIIYLQWHNDHPTANSSTGSYNLLKMTTGSSGGVALGDSPTWTGNHVFQEDVEIGTGTDDLLTIKSAIKGHTVAVNDPDGDGTLSIADTVFVDANLDMNTWNIYDLDSLHFGIGTSSTSPAFDVDSNGIDASPDGLNFYTRQGDDIKFFIGVNSGLSSKRMALDGGASELIFYGYELNMNQNKIINVSDPVNNQDAVNKQWFNANQSGGISAGDNVNWTGVHKFENSLTELGNGGSDVVKFIGEVHGNTGISMSNPAFGGSDILVPGSDPALMIKSAMVCNTYTMYDLDTVVFAVGGSSTTPPPLDEWVWIEANTGTSGNPTSSTFTGMHYNVPSSKSHQFKVDGTEEVVIDSDGIELTGTNFIKWNTAYLYSPNTKTGSDGDTLSPDLWLKVKYQNNTMYIPAYY